MLDLGKQVEIDADSIHKALNDETIAYEVQQDILEARSIGVSGVPFFVLNNKYAVSGAQPAEVFTDAMQQAFSEIQNLNTTNDANSCSIDGCD